MQTFNDKCKNILFKTDHVDKNLINSHKWKLYNYSEYGDGGDYWLVCQNCKAFYGLIFFSSNAVIKLFKENINSFKNDTFKSCNEIIMLKACI